MESSIGYWISLYVPPISPPILCYLCSTTFNSAPYSSRFRSSSCIFKWVCMRWTGRQLDRITEVMSPSQEISESGIGLFTKTLLAWPTVKHRAQWSKSLDFSTLGAPACSQKIQNKHPEIMLSYRKSSFKCRKSYRQWGKGCHLGLRWIGKL